MNDLTTSSAPRQGSLPVTVSPPSGPPAAAGRRRRHRLLLAVAVAVALLAGCTPAGLDGEVADDWPRLAAPQMFQPAAQTCHTGGFAESASVHAYDPVECSRSHATETVHVGTFRGDHGSGAAPPRNDSAAIRAAYAECEQAVKDFLGEDWRAGRLYLGVTVPTAAAWRGGARWFRCELHEVQGKDDDTLVRRTGSLQDALRGDRPLGHGCYRVTSSKDRVTDMKAVSCTETHNAEFVGVHVPADGPYVRLNDARWSAYHAACRSLIARYVGISAAAARSAGSVASPLGETEWKRGNRGVLCHLWLESNNVRSSLKAAGALPR